jgi:hypothetical protein
MRPVERWDEYEHTSWGEAWYYIDLSVWGTTVWSMDASRVVTFLNPNSRFLICLSGV